MIFLGCYDVAFCLADVEKPRFSKINMQLNNLLLPLLKANDMRIILISSYRKTCLSAVELCNAKQK